MSTSDASPFVSYMERPLTPEEYRLLEVLIAGQPQREELRCQLTQARVQSMKDGAMGSLRFVSSHPDRKSRELVEATSIDSDGTPIQIAVNVDQYGELFELDMWKVDFSPLICIPHPAQVQFA